MRFLNRLAVCSAFFLGLNLAVVAADNTPGDELLRLSYQSKATGKQRDYFVYLPRGYRLKQQHKWPVLLFLHGHGQRGDGKADLDYILRHGPLMEAWIQKRPLPFIIISPQLAFEFGIPGLEEDHSKDARPERNQQGVPERNPPFKSDLPIQRQDSSAYPDGLYRRFEPYPDFGGWIDIKDELMLMLDTVLNNYHADPGRVYLTGISYGGFGTFDLAATYPLRWAAIAPVVGTGKLKDVEKLAKAGIPTWLFGGGKDRSIKPHWLYRMADSLERAGHPALRFTVHEDMDHDAWKRVYEGEDLYNWFLSHETTQDAEN